MKKKQEARAAKLAKAAAAKLPKAPKAKKEPKEKPHKSTRNKENRKVKPKKEKQKKEKKPKVPKVPKKRGRKVGSGKKATKGKKKNKRTLVDEALKFPSSLYDYGRTALSPVPGAAKDSWMDMGMLDAQGWGSVNFLFGPSSNAGFSVSSSASRPKRGRPAATAASSATPSKRPSSKRAKIDAANSLTFSPYALGKITDRDIAQYFGDAPMSNPCWSPGDVYVNGADENSRFSAGIAITPMRASIHASPLGLTKLMNTSPVKRFIADSRPPTPKSSRRLDEDTASAHPPTSVAGGVNNASRTLAMEMSAAAAAAAAAPSSDIPSSAASVQDDATAEFNTQTPPMAIRSVALLRESSTRQYIGFIVLNRLAARLCPMAPLLRTALAATMTSRDSRPHNNITASAGPARNERVKMRIQGDSPASASSASAA